MFEWIEARNNQRNLYWSVNEVVGRLTSKASREDIKSVRFLHVDIDPRAGEDIEQERKRALKALTGFIPKPNCIIFSGGGYQGFWRLADPIQVDGDLTSAEEAKRYNMQLETVFSADTCHNIDRIMRLPGTINLPDAKKKAKGRKPELASVTYFDSGQWANDQFTMARKVQAAGESFTPQVQVSGNIPRLDDVQDIDGHATSTVSDKCKIIIVQGHDPDEPNKYGNSRSEWLFSVCCSLVRAGVSNDMIYSVITDPDFGISASVLDKGSNAEKYALRQIEQAHEHAIDPMLRKLNDKHAVISNLGGKCLVIEEAYCEALEREKITFQGFGHFTNRYMNQKVQTSIDEKGNVKTKPAGRWWLEHESRRQYESLVFAPGQEVKDAYNLWRGFGVEAKEGDCGLYLDHIFHNICNQNQEYFNYLIGWMARAVQCPGEQGEVAVVLRGKQGTGKGWFARIFGKLWGRHFLQVNTAKHLVGDFNAHLRDCVVLFADEAFYAGDKQHESVLKGIITEDTLTIMAKGIDMEPAPNYLHVIMASNSNWVVPAGNEERRYFVLDVDDEHMQDRAYFGQMIAQMKKGGYEALLDYLLKYDISEYEVRAIPQTEALQEQKTLSYGPEAAWWFDKLCTGRLLPTDNKWEGRVSRQSMQDEYLLYAQQRGQSRHATATVLGKFFRKACPEGWPKTRQVKCANGNRPYEYEFPSLDACREHWDADFGGPFRWATTEGDGVEYADEVRLGNAVF